MKNRMSVVWGRPQVCTKGASSNGAVGTHTADARVDQRLRIRPLSAA